MNKNEYNRYVVHIEWVVNRESMWEEQRYVVYANANPRETRAL